MSAAALASLAEMPPQVQAIVRGVCAERRVGVRDVLSDARFPHIAQARMEAMARARELEPQPSFPTIGRWFGRNHTTAMDAWRRMRGLGRRGVGR